jgi:hypothetical protein
MQSIRQSTPRAREARTILSISLPLIAAYLAEMGMLITDMIIVGRLGSNELAAVGLSADWFYVLLLMGMGVVSIVGVLAAQSLGAQDPKGARHAVEQGLIIATLMSVPVMLGIWYLGPALRLANQDPHVLQLVISYSRPLAWCVLPVLWFAVLRSFVTAMARTSVIANRRSPVLNPAINYVLRSANLASRWRCCSVRYRNVNWLMFTHVGSCRRPVRSRMSPVTCADESTGKRWRKSCTRAAGHCYTDPGAGMFTVAARRYAEATRWRRRLFTPSSVALSTSIAIGDAVRGLPMASACSRCRKAPAHIAFAFGAGATP